MKYNKLILIFVSLVLVCNIVNANIIFDEVKCSKDGSLEFTVYSEDSKIDVNNVKIIARQKDQFDLTISKTEINGSWSLDYISNGGASFKSGTAQIKNAGAYDIILNYIEEDLNKNAVWTLDCPGLIFSCNLLSIDIKNCTNVDDKYFNLLIEIAGTNQSIVSQIEILDGIKYSLVAKNSYKDIKGLDSDRGSLPEDIKINKLDKDLYLFSKEFQDNIVSSVNVYIEEYESECNGAKIYDYQECIEIHTKQIENNKSVIENKPMEQKEAPKITADIIKVNETKKKNNYWIYIVLGIIIILISIFIIIKKTKG